MLTAAGTGGIAFGGAGILALGDAALTGGNFAQAITAFAAGDGYRWWTGLAFDPANHSVSLGTDGTLTVESGGVTDTLHLAVAAGVSLGLASDGHGGTVVADVLSVGTEAELNAAIYGSAYIINLTGNIALTNGPLQAIDPGSDGIVLIDGNGFAIEGNGQQGLVALSGTVSLDNLAITNAVAQGGAGGAGGVGGRSHFGGGAGGGGAGLGGGLFVGGAANVTLNNVSFSGDKAIGGAGGSITAGHGSSVDLAERAPTAPPTMGARADPTTPAFMAARVPAATVASAAAVVAAAVVFLPLAFPRAVAGPEDLAPAAAAPAPAAAAAPAAMAAAAVAGSAPAVTFLSSRAVT